MECCGLAVQSFDRKACCTTNPQLIKQAEFGFNGPVAELYYSALSSYIQPFRHNTPTLQTDGQEGLTDNSLIAQGEPFYKRSPKNGNKLETESRISKYMQD